MLVTDLTEVTREIERMQLEFEQVYSDLTNTELLQPVHTFISIGHYMAVHGRFIYDVQLKPAGYYHKENRTGYVYIPKCDLNGDGSDIYWGVLLRNIIASMGDAKRIVLDFRGCFGGSIYGFASGLVGLIIGSQVEAKNESTGVMLIRKFLKDGLYSYHNKKLTEYQPWPIAEPCSFDEIVVLVDGNSSSAGEVYPLLLANRGAKLYGTQTAGYASGMEMYAPHVNGVKRMTFSEKLTTEGNDIKPLKPAEPVPASIWW